MIRVCTKTGTWLMIDMRAFSDVVSMKVDRVTEILLGPSDVEALLTALLHFRERQRDFTTEDESKAPPPAHARTTGKKSKPTTK